MSACCALALLALAGRAGALSALPDYDALDLSICSGPEMAVIQPVDDLVEKITGKVTTREVVEPRQAPEQCRTPIGAHRSNCWVAWGFARDAAECFATERFRSSHNCAEQCAGSVYHRSCQACLGPLRMERRTCMMESMNISKGCTDCHIAAHQYWEDTCVLDCRTAFAFGQDNNNLPCKRCNDLVFYDKLAKCGGKPAPRRPNTLPSESPPAAPNVLSVST
mmetsp:Transcript_119706/g.339277  ORF Transcript_119706/g.339277 Transcript_119706/m.339277 type:complete len:222 (-) Transcript_119706:27-692(-)